MITEHSPIRIYKRWLEYSLDFGQQRQRVEAFKIANSIAISDLVLEVAEESLLGQITKFLGCNFEIISKNSYSPHRLPLYPRHENR